MKLYKILRVNILNGLKQIMTKAKNTVIVSDYIFNDAIEYDEVTENFKKRISYYK